MTEYIEREALLEQINDDCKYAKASNDYQRGCNEVCDWAIKTIKNIPTADVVPRAKYEELKDVLRRYQEYYKTKEDAVAEAKQEVAREIFAEIENAHEECIHIDPSTNIGYLLQSKFEHKLAELKKKYTEGAE